ncbi:MAG: FG-GAP-like repeat-containing protein [Terriglobales bacterium]
MWLLTVFVILSGKSDAQSYAFGVAAFPVPSSPFAIASGDFNGDGRPDLIVATYSEIGNGAFSILLGQADGTFAPYVEYTVGENGATGLAVGDFNGDGNLDLVVLASPGFQICYGNGDGIFQPAASFKLSFFPSAVAVGDFNKDGKLDLAFAGGGSDNPVVAVLLGKGNGGFGPEVDYATPGSTTVITGDFNGDGNLDLAIGGGDAYLGVSILLGKGDGTFGSYIATEIPTYGGASIAAADLNRDGKLDLVAGPWQYYPGGVSVLLGNGDGTFGPPVFYPTPDVGSGPNVVAIADFNGDGNPDVATANYVGDDATVFLGKGDGTLETGVPYPSSINPVGIVTGDFNGDGLQDIASVAGYSTSAEVIVDIGRGDGTFANYVNRTVPGSPYALVAGDFNGDGKPDLAMTNFSNPGLVAVLLNKGKDVFQIVTDEKVGQHPAEAVAGDFNNDGRPDLVIAGGSESEQLTSLLGDGNGKFGSAVSQTIANIPYNMVAADFNLDGKLDIVTGLQQSGGVTVYEGHGDGTFSVASQTSIGADALEVFTADFNGDSKPDVAASTDNGISILLGKGDGTFLPVQNIFPENSVIAVGDFNGDGKVDLVLEEGQGYGIALGSGDGTFQAPSQITYLPAALDFSATVVGDFNGDGKLDLAFIGETGTLSIAPGNGDGTFGQRIDLPADASTWSLATADFSGAGGLDLAVGIAVTGSSGLVSNYANRPVGALYPSPLQFGSQTIGSQITLNTTLYNSGGTPMAISEIKTKGDYSQTNTCGASLAVGSSCAISVTFKPKKAGSLSGSLIVEDSSTVKPQTVVLTGTGVK